jgi:hypothetical protein
MGLMYPSHSEEAHTSAAKAFYFWSIKLSGLKP